jgi:ribonuclease P protein component
MRAVIERLQRSADFERVLRTAARAHSAHFAVHHLNAAPSLPAKPRRASGTVQLSTGEGSSGLRPVDESAALASAGRPATRRAAVWLGAVVPKRHARRAVTRTLLKRQIRAAAAGQERALTQGLWVVRLRASFDRLLFTSAASEALRLAARGELDGLLARATRL